MMGSSASAMNSSRRAYHGNALRLGAVSLLCTADFWVERLPKLLGALAPPQSA
jgi:hypothetical protein